MSERIETPPIDPISLYDVALATDRVLKIKRALESAGFSVKIKTTVTVAIDMDIRLPKKKAGKR
jgi:hypothetical protein